MEHLWSPWRMKYIQQHEPSGGCVFCAAHKAAQDGPHNLVLYRAEHSFVILNAYPYSNGHLMVVPYEHHPTIEDLGCEVRAEMMELVSQAMTVLRSVYHPEAFNMGANIGAAAGAGIAAHVHIHILPRWAGDTNFMSTIGQTRVIPEELPETYRRLREAWK